MLPRGFLSAFLIRRTLASGNLIEGLPLRFHSDVEYRESMVPETCPAILMITSPPSPASASSVTWRSP